MGARQPSSLCGCGGRRFGSSRAVLVLLGGSGSFAVVREFVLLFEMWWALHGVVASVFFPVGEGCG